jgi:uncharacterized membrane protein YfcA
MIEKDLFILMIFAVIMLATSFSMIKTSEEVATNYHASLSNPIIKNLFIIFEAIMVGVVTAIIGAGGGFLIVPALIILNKIDIKTAIGSSLFIIAIKSLGGFVGDIQAGTMIDYYLSFKLLILAIVGMFLGIILSKYLNSKYLKKGFGYFVILTSILIIIKELIL